MPLLLSSSRVIWVLRGLMDRFYLNWSELMSECVVNAGDMGVNGLGVPSAQQVLRVMWPGSETFDMRSGHAQGLCRKRRL